MNERDDDEEQDGDDDQTIAIEYGILKFSAAFSPRSVTVIQKRRACGPLSSEFSISDWSVVQSFPFYAVDSWVDDFLLCRI